MLCERALILCYLNPVSNNSIPTKKAENLRFVWKLKAKKSSFVESINTVYLENLTIVIQPDFKCYGVSLDEITVGWNFIIEYAFLIFFSVIFLYSLEKKNYRQCIWKINFCKINFATNQIHWKETQQIQKKARIVIRVFENSAVLRYQSKFPSCFFFFFFFNRKPKGSLAGAP